MTIEAISFKDRFGHSYDQGHVTIWMGYTQLDQLTTSFEYNYTPGTKTKVFDHADVQTGGGTPDSWFTLQLDTPFEYDGQSNLLIDIETVDCNTIYVWGWNTGSNRNVHTYISGASTGTVLETIPHLQLHGPLELATTTFGRIKTLF